MRCAHCAAAQPHHASRHQRLGGGAEVAVATSLGGLPIAAAVDNGSLFWIVDFTGSVQGAASDGGTFRVGVNGTSGRDLVLKLPARSAATGDPAQAEAAALRSWAGTSAA